VRKKAKNQHRSAFVGRDLERNFTATAIVIATTATVATAMLYL
jgi:hypothetical protein